MYAQTRRPQPQALGVVAEREGGSAGARGSEGCGNIASAAKWGLFSILSIRLSPRQFSNECSVLASGSCPVPARGIPVPQWQCPDWYVLANSEYGFISSAASGMQVQRAGVLGPRRLHPCLHLLPRGESWHTLMVHLHSTGGQMLKGSPS